MASLTREVRAPGYRWLQLILGILCMAMIANLQYGWTPFVSPLIQSTIEVEPASPPARSASRPRRARGPMRARAIGVSLVSFWKPGLAQAGEISSVDQILRCTPRDNLAQAGDAGIAIIADQSARLGELDHSGFDLAS